MSKLTAIVSILLAAILTNNIVLSRFLGVGAFLDVSKKPGRAAGLGAAVTVVMVAATAATHPLYTYLLSPKFAYLETVVFVLVIIAVVQLLGVILKTMIKPVYRAVADFFPLLTTNCAVLGITLISVSGKLSFTDALIGAAGAGLGFLLSLLLFSGVKSRMETADIPEFMKGLPIMLIAAALISLSLLGFSGIGS